MYSTLFIPLGMNKVLITKQRVLDILSSWDGQTSQMGDEKSINIR